MKKSENGVQEEHTDDGNNDGPTIRVTREVTHLIIEKIQSGRQLLISYSYSLKCVGRKKLHVFVYKQIAKF